MSAERLLTRSFLLVFLASLTQSLSYLLFLHLPRFLNELGASDARVGLIWALAPVCAILVRPALGRAMDERGRRPVILLGGALNTVACLLYLGVSRIGFEIYAVRVIHGISEALLFASLFTYAADCVPARRRTQGLALFGVSTTLPFALSGLLGDAILARGDFGDVFLAAAAMGFLSLLFSLPLRDAAQYGPGASRTRGMWAALRERDLMPLWWIGGVFAVALTAVFVFVRRYVDDTGLGTVGGFFTAYSASALVMRLFLGWLPDRLGAKRVLLPSLALLVVAFATIALADHPGEVVAAGLLFGAGHGMAFPILFGMLVSRAPERERGSATAIFTALFDGGMLLGGPAFGYLIDVAGYTVMYGVAAVVVVAGTAVFAVWDRKR